MKKLMRKLRKVAKIAVGAVIAVASFGLGLAGGIATIIATAIPATAAPIIGTASVSTILGSAITGAVTGSINAAIGGGNILKGALGGLVGGAVGPIISGAAGSVLGSGTAAQIAGKTLGGLGGGAAGALATGARPEQILRSALLGGAGGLVSGAAQFGFGVSPETAGQLGAVAGAGLKAALPPLKGKQQPQAQRAPTGASATARTAPQGQPQAPTTQGATRTLRPALQAALAGTTSPVAGALSLGGGLGYTPGATVFGSGESDKPRRNVWNRGSLRSLSEEG